MKDTDFKSILENLNTHLTDCRTYLDKIKTSDDLKNLTLKEAVELKHFCQKEEKAMTKICMVDLYHIIGMGELNIVQQNTFLKSFKEYCTYRAKVKVFAKELNNIEHLPSLPSKTFFRLLELGDVKLSANFLEDSDISQETDLVDNVESYSDASRLVCADIKESNIVIDGVKATVPLSDVDNFIRMLQGSVTEEMRDTLIKKATTKGKYLGVSWETKGESLVGLLTKDILHRLLKFKDVIAFVK